MAGEELELGLAKSMHWSYSKLTSEGKPVPWKALTRQERALWVRMARRAIKRLEKLTEATAEGGAALAAPGGAMGIGSHSESASH